MAEEREGQDAWVTRLVTEEGPGVLGYLTALLGGAGPADDVFSAVVEAAWKGAPRFEGRSSPRTWLYAIARRQAARWRRDRALRREDAISVPDAVALAARTTTTRWRKTEARDRLAELRDALNPADRELLVLRIDRGMSWTDVATVLGEADGEDPDGLARASARVRQRFGVLVRRLRSQAAELGLAPGSSSGDR